MDVIDLLDYSQNQNVRAFLRMLRHGEGTSGEDGYQIMFGGEKFSSFSDHPRRKITKPMGKTKITSTAAGAYQFLERTWDGLVRQYGFKDFSPENQDLAAIALIVGRGAIQDVIAGRFETAVLKCNREWASLPGSPYGQPVVTMAKAREVYLQFGGKEIPWGSNSSSAASVPQSSPSSAHGSEVSESAKQTHQQKSPSVTLSGWWSRIAALLTRR
jgi:muramidase (phage lysozyme)